MFDLPMNVDICVVKDGVWVYHGRDCPHARQSDEAGPVVPTGWTAQQTRAQEKHHGN